MVNCLGASVDLCFYSRDDSTTKGDFKVGDFEKMLNTVHANIIAKYPYCARDKVRLDLHLVSLCTCLNFSSLLSSSQACCAPVSLPPLVYFLFVRSHSWAADVILHLLINPAHVNCAMLLQWTDNHYAIDSFSADTTKIVSYIDANNVPVYCEGTAPHYGDGICSA